MTKVVIDMSMSLDGFVAGPGDGRADPLGRHGGTHLFDWYFWGEKEYGDPLFRPELLCRACAYEGTLPRSTLKRKTSTASSAGWRHGFKSRWDYQQNGGSKEASPPLTRCRHGFGQRA
jgi:hypothetical protein